VEAGVAQGTIAASAAFDCVRFESDVSRIPGESNVNGCPERPIFAMLADLCCDLRILGKSASKRPDNHLDEQYPNPLVLASRTCFELAS